MTGSRKVALEDELSYYDGDIDRIARLKKATGLAERYLVEPGTTAVDLAEAATHRLTQVDGFSLDQLDAMLFVTQTPDHFQPSNAAVLHGRLGLPKSVAAFDVNLGCSGWVYALWQAASLIAASSLQRVLILAGDTLSRQIDARDRATAPLFGDAATATLVEAKPDAVLHIALGTDGSGAQAITVPAGAMREPASDLTAQAMQDADGNWRSPQNLFLDGPEVFQFTLREVPKAINELLDAAKLTTEAIDYFFLHQANGFILSNLARRLKVSLDRVPSQSLSRYGNLSSASIPSVICDTLADAPSRQAQRCLLCGYGVGLSWATALTDLSNTTCLPVAHYGND